MVPFAFLSGCTGPDKANIVLRKQNQELRDEIATLKRARDADAATIRSLQEARNGPAVAMLPQERIEKLFTTHGLKLGRLTGGARTNPNSPGDDAIKVYAVPTDDDAEPLKAAGSFVVEVFDLNEPDKPLLARREFGSDEARKNWFGEALLYTYVLTCPLEHPPRHSELTVHVKFSDELTGRMFEEQKVVRLTPGDATTTTATTSPR